MATPPLSRALPLAAGPVRPDVAPGVSGLVPAALADWLAARGEPAYRARQIADAVWRGTESSFDDIRTLPGSLRSALGESFRFDTVGETEVRVSDGGLTEKALHRLADGAL